VTYVVANNASYAILKAGMLTFGLPAAKRGVFPGMDLVGPEIDYLALARSMGVLAERVERPGALREALVRAIGHPGPALVDVAIDRGFEAMRRRRRCLRAESGWSARSRRRACATSLEFPASTIFRSTTRCCSSRKSRTSSRVTSRVPPSWPTAMRARRERPAWSW